MSRLTAAQARQVLEPSLLRPDATLEEVETFCRRALRDRFETIVLEPHWVARAVRMVGDFPLRVGAVAGYPFGATDSATKLFEIDRALEAGARDIDLVMNIGAFRSHEDVLVGQEIRRAADSVHGVSGRRLKVIVETGYLTPEQLARAAVLVAEAGGDFVKTGTGYGPRGVTVDDVRAIRRALHGRARIKAAGGVRTADEVQALLKAGADRVGSSRAFEILEEVSPSLGAPPRADLAVHHPSAAALAGHLDDVR